MNQEGISRRTDRYTRFEGIAVFGKDGMAMAFNSPMEQVLGCTAKEAFSLERLMDRFFPGGAEDAPMRMQRLRDCSESGDYVRVLDARGGERWCRIAFSDGEDGSLILHCLDCSAEKGREDALRKSEGIYRSLFEESRDAISFYGPKTVVNRAWLDLFGYSREEMDGFDPTCLYANPEDRARFIRELEEKGFVKDFEVRLRNKNGTEVDCLYTTTAYRDENGVLCYRGIAHDITHLKQTLAAQRESEEKFRTLFEESKDAISFYRPGEHTANQAWLDLFGYTREELKDLDILKLYVHPEERVRFERELDAKGYVRDFEEDLIHKNGEIIRCVSTARTHHAEDGSVKYYQSILRDITPMKRMIEALRESEEKFRHLVENIREVIYAVDTGGVITYISPVIETLSGYSARDLVGRPLADVHYIYPPDLHKVNDSFRDAASGKPNSHEFRFLTRHGEILWFSASVYAVVRGGEVTGFQGILVDITRSVQAKRELLESEERLSSFLDSATDSFLLIDSYLNLAEINQTARKEFNLRKEDVLGKSLSSFLKTIRYPEDPLAFIDVLNTGEPSAIKEVCFGDSWFDFKVFKVGYGLGIIATNITDQKRAGEALHQARAELEKRVAERTADLRKANEDLERQISERKRAQDTLTRRESELNALLNNLPDMAWFKDAESKFILVNEALAKRSGMSVERLKGLTDLDIWQIEEAERFMADDRRILETGEMLRVEEPLTDRSGRTMVIETIKGPIRDESGKNVATVGIARDITDRKQFEESLRTSEERYRGIFEVIPISVWEYDFSECLPLLDEVLSSGIDDYRAYLAKNPDIYQRLISSIRPLDVNRETLRMYGAVSKEELFREAFKHAIPEAMEATRDIIVAYLNGETDIVLETVNETIDLRRIEIILRITFTEEMKRSGRVLATVEDITERKRAESALRAARDNLEERVRERTKVLARINRELEREIIEREAAERALQFYSDFQKRISYISTNFINVPAREIDAGINDALRIIGEFSGGERGFLYRFSNSSEEAVLTHEWCGEGIPARFVTIPRFSLKEYPSVLSKLEQFQIVHVPSLSLFSEANPEEWKRYAASHIQSFIFVPMIQSGALVGVFGFDSLSREQTWDTESFPLLTLVGEMLVNALERNAAELRILDYQEKLRSIASELTLTEERERRRIAVELHDRIGQLLVVSRIKLGALKGHLPSGNPEKTIDEINEFINEAIGDTRSLIFEISPPLLYDLGFEPALEWLVENVQKQHGIEAEFRDDGREKPLEHNLRVLLFQSVRELLVNVVKHSLARRVVVTVWREDSMVGITVEDNGVGFDTGTLELRSMRNIGFGLFSIRERLEHSGGGFSLESKPGAGTAIRLTAPIIRDK